MAVFTHEKPIMTIFLQNGTCYTAQECSQRGGSNAGTCALGYGTCCTCKFAIVSMRHKNDNFWLRIFFHPTVIAKKRRSKSFKSRGKAVIIAN